VGGFEYAVQNDRDGVFPVFAINAFVKHGSFLLSDCFYFVAICKA
jgi:hypothetical protein